MKLKKQPRQHVNQLCGVNLILHEEQTVRRAKAFIEKLNRTQLVSFRLQLHLDTEETADGVILLY